MPGPCGIQVLLSTIKTMSASVLNTLGLNGTAWTLPGLRFAAQVTLEPRKAGFWLLASFAKWEWLPTGSLCEVSGLLCHPIPPAQALPGAP